MIFCYFSVNYVRYLVTVPSFKCLTFSHQKRCRGWGNFTPLRANTRPKYHGGNRFNAREGTVSNIFSILKVFDTIKLSLLDLFGIAFSLFCKSIDWFLYDGNTGC